MGISTLKVGHLASNVSLLKFNQMAGYHKGCENLFVVGEMSGVKNAD